MLEWTKQRSDVGKIGLVGISFGGMLCARAAAKLTGLSAVVLEPAAYNAIDLWHDTEAVTAVKKALAGSPADQAAAKTQVNQVMSAAFPHLPRTTQFMIYKRGSIYTTTTQTDARANRAPTDYYDLLATMASDFLADFGQLKIPTMITENEGDQFFQDQGAAAYAALTNVPPQDKLLLPLTAAQGAQLHDQPTGPQVAQGTSSTGSRPISPKPHRPTGPVKRSPGPCRGSGKSEASAKANCSVRSASRNGPAWNVPRSAALPVISAAGIDQDARFGQVLLIVAGLTEPAGDSRRRRQMQRDGGDDLHCRDVGDVAFGLRRRGRVGESAGARDCGSGTWESVTGGSLADAPMRRVDACTSGG